MIVDELDERLLGKVQAWSCLAFLNSGQLVHWQLVLGSDE